MPQYLLSVWQDDEYEVDVTGDAVQRLVAQVGAFDDDLAAAGAMVFAAGLMPAGRSRSAQPGRWRWTSVYSGASGVLPAIRSAAFSASIITGA